MNETSIFDLFGDESTKTQISNDWKWKLSDYPKEKNGLTVFSCFACGGGSTMGYKLSGCDVIGCVEIDEKMIEIYKNNHHPKYPFCMDLREFNEIPNERLPQELFNLDILDGSPPCTTFSMSGLREETWGKEKRFREGQKKQTLDDLSFVFIDTVKKLSPKVVIMENVEGLLFGDAWSYVQQIYKSLNDAGYKTNRWLLKGEQMGIPQRRHRAFFVAIRKDLNIDPSWLDMSFRYKPVLYGEIKQGEGEHLNPETMDYKMLGKAKRCDSNIANIYERLGEKPKRFSAMLCWDDAVLPTILAQLFHYRPIEKSRISAMDVIHAQTFPEDFDFMAKSTRDIEYVCGMSVPPVMMKRVVTKLIEQGVFNYRLDKGLIE